MIISQFVVNGHTCQLINNNNYIDFMIDDFQDAFVSFSKKEQLMIVRTAIRQFEEYVSTLDSGTVLKGFACLYDGKGAQRIKLYKRMGFYEIDDMGAIEYVVK